MAMTTPDPATATMAEMLAYANYVEAEYRGARNYSDEADGGDALEDNVTDPTIEP